MFLVNNLSLLVFSFCLVAGHTWLSRYTKLIILSESSLFPHISVYSRSIALKSTLGCVPLQLNDMSVEVSLFLFVFNKVESKVFGSMGIVVLFEELNGIS